MSRVLVDSGIKWIGSLPNTWGITTVNKIFYRRKEVNDVENPTVLSLARDGVKIRDISTNEGQLAESYDNYHKVYKNDLMINPMDLISGANCSLSQVEGVISPAYINLAKKENIFPKYYDYFFKYQYWVNAMFIHGKGVSFDNRWTMNWETMSSYKLPFPKYEEQKNIANYLDKQCAKIDEIISDNNREIELLDEYKDNIIYDYFKEIKEEIKLKYIISSNTRTLSEKGNEEKEIMYIDIGSVNSDGEITNTEKYMFKNAPSRARRIVKTNDVIISTVRTYLKAIALINSVYDDYICSTGFSVLKPSNMIDSKYLFYALKNICFTDKVSANSTGISYPAITDSKLINLKIKITDFNNQKLISNKIDKKINKINEVVEYRKQIIEKLEEYKRSLIYECVTGKREV